MYDLMGMAEFVNPSPSDTNSLPASEAIPESTKGISHLLTGDAARQDQLFRLRTKIAEGQMPDSSASEAKQMRWEREESLLARAINRYSGGLPSRSVDLVTF